MPTISMFYGIVVQMFWNEHAPPHFHVKYVEFQAAINIQTLEIMSGKMPKRQLSLILKWANQHRVELLEDWKLCEKQITPKEIAPLK